MRATNSTILRLQVLHAVLQIYMAGRISPEPAIDSSHTHRAMLNLQTTSINPHSQKDLTIISLPQPASALCIKEQTTAQNLANNQLQAESMTQNTTALQTYTTPPPTPTINEQCSPAPTGACHLPTISPAAGYLHDSSNMSTDLLSWGLSLIHPLLHISPTHRSPCPVFP